LKNGKIKDFIIKVINVKKAFIHIKQLIKIKVKIQKNQEHGYYKTNMQYIIKKDLMSMGMLSNLIMIYIDVNILIKIKIQLPQLLGY